MLPSPTQGLAQHFAWVAAVLLAAQGCQLGRGQPDPRSLMACRQLSQQGLSALETDNCPQAEHLLARAVQSCPVDAEARRYYAEALWRQGNQAEALSQIEAALQLAGDDPVILVKAARMNLALGQVAAAREQIERAIDLDPLAADAWTTRGHIQCQSGGPHEALADYHRALSIRSDCAETLLAVAEVHRQLNEPQSALATLHSLADTYPPGEEPAQVLYLMGLAYQAAGRPADAVDALAAARDRGQTSAEILYRLAEAELSLGQDAQARSTVEQALAIQPQHTACRTLLSRIELASDQPNRPPTR